MEQPIEASIRIGFRHYVHLLRTKDQKLIAALWGAYHAGAHLALDVIEDNKLDVIEDNENNRPEGSND